MDGDIVNPAGEPLSRTDWHFSRRVLAPVVLVGVAMVALVTFALFWSTTRSDTVSVQRQIKAAQHAIADSINILAGQQEILALWEEAVYRTRDIRDAAWMDPTFGNLLTRQFGHDQVYVLDRADRPLYARIGEQRLPAARFEDVRPDLAVLIDEVRGRTTGQAHEHDRLPGHPVKEGNYLRTTDRATHASHFLRVSGRPAVASVMEIDYPGIKRAPGSESLVVSLRFLDQNFFREMGRRALMDAPRYTGRRGKRAGEEELPLVTEHGQTIGYFYWRPELPGSVIMAVLAPVGVLFTLVVGLLMSALVRKLRRATTELQASESQAVHLAFHDTLTGLANRALFAHRLDQALVAAQSDGRTLAVLYLDLDHFKIVNDTLGHPAGDALIRGFAGRVARELREGDTVARLGGDEFAVLLDKVSGAAEVERICERLLATVDEPFELGARVFVGVSIGVALADGGMDRIELIRKADIALYRAKNAGRNRYCFFSDEMDESVRVRGEIEQELRAALIKGDQLHVCFQPQLATSSGRSQIIGLEALVRWSHPTRGAIPPEQFVPIAEEAGLMLQLGDWIMAEACAAARRWPTLYVAVNLSPVQLRAPDFLERTMALVVAAGIEPSRIELEVTEGVLIAGDEVYAMLTRLREAGFRIALDDFGTGYSSLSYLHRFKVDKIKIDRSFVQHLGQSVDSTVIVQAIVTLAQAMGLRVTAEGVETADQQRFLASVGCQELQGFYFSHAVSSEEIDKLLRIVRPISSAA